MLALTVVVFLLGSALGGVGFWLVVADGAHRCLARPRLPADHLRLDAPARG
jgi:hypothetical protein